MQYKNINLIYYDEKFRLNRLQSVVDEIYNTIPNNYIYVIKSLEDTKGTLKVIWKEEPSLFFKNLINIIWYDNPCYEDSEVEHIILSKAIKQPQKEDPEIKKYLKSL